MEDNCLCDSVTRQVNELFIDESRMFDWRKASGLLFLLFGNKEYECIVNIIKVIPNNALQGAIIQDFVSEIIYRCKDELLLFYNRISYYRLKIYITYMLGWEYLDSCDLDSAKEIQIQTLDFIKKDCPLLSDYYLSSIINQYFQSKMENKQITINYDIYIDFFYGMLVNKQIFNGVKSTILDYDSDYMYVFDSEYMVSGHKNE